MIAHGISVLAGLGGVALIRLRLEQRTAALLAPVLTLALWAIVLGAGVSL